MSRRRLPRRWWMFRLTDALAALAPVPKNQKGVVILRMFGIGDALLFRAVLEKYAEALGVPVPELTILGSTAWSTAGNLFFGGIKIEWVDEKRFARHFFYRLRTMLTLRRRGFETAICGMRFRYPHVIESLMLASGAPERIIAEPRPNEKFDAMFAHYLPRMTRVIPLPEHSMPRGNNGEPLPLMHEIEHQLAFLSAVAGHPITLPTLPMLAAPAGAAPSMQPGERYAVLNIGASHAPRRWPLADYFEIARRLSAQGYTVMFLGGPAERNLRHDIETFIAGETGRGRMLVSIGGLDLAGATRLIAHASIVVSSDTGIGHLSVMLGRPSVLIVGGGHFGCFMPYPQSLTPPHVRFLCHLMPCYHCNWNCAMMPPGGKTFPCVANVTVEQAWAALAEINPA